MRRTVKQCQSDISTSLGDDLNSGCRNVSNKQWSPLHNFNHAIMEKSPWETDVIQQYTVFYN